MSKLRFLYNNLADTAVITSTNTAAGYPTTNLQSDLKGLVWRSASTLSTVITLAWATNQTLDAVFLPYTNLSSTATVRFVLKNSANTTLYDSGSLLVSNLYTLPQANAALTNNQYSFGTGTSLRQYFSTLTTVRSLEITIVDGSNPQSFMEIGRIVCGKYLQFDFNVSFGLGLDVLDSSSSLRTEAGNLVVQRGTTHKVLNFSLDYMSQANRDTLFQLFKQFGIHKSFMVSVFPEDSDKSRESMYELYGKLSGNQFSITHPLYSQYTTSISIQEV